MRCEKCGFVIRCASMYCPRCGNVLLPSDSDSSISHSSENPIREEPELSQLIERYQADLRRKRKRVPVFLAFVALVYTILLLYFVILKSFISYSKAVSLIQKEKYRQASDILTQLDYKDSRKLKKDIQFKDPYVGEKVFLGSYEQDNIPDNGKEDLEWTIIDMDESSVLLLSSKCIDWIPYHSNLQVSWENTFLRKWLRTTFWDEAFTEKEKSHISTFQKDETVFLLNRDEVIYYFPNLLSRIAYATPYTEAKADYSLRDSACDWWLAGNSEYDDFDDNYNVISIYHDGGFYGANLGRNNGGGVRPVIWYHLKKN